MSKKRRVLIAAGGTGGHIYPAMGSATKLIEREQNLEVMFAAGGLLESPFFDRQAFAGQSISAAPLTKKAPIQLIKSCGAIAKGVWQSCKLLSNFKPDLVIGFGSYHSFPVLTAAKLLKYPIALHEQNSKPGKVIRLFSKYALITGVYFPAAKHALKGKTTLLSMPLRKGYSRETCSKAEACRYFQIESNKVTLLVFGGSQGAKFINQTVAQLLVEQFRAGNDFQVLHFAGNPSDACQVANLYERNGLNAIVKPLESRMDYAWRAADLAIVRAGAGTIAEQIEFEVPSIFIPYPHAADGHQESNADFIESIQGGWKWNEQEWQPQNVTAALQQLLQSNSCQRKEMQKNLALYKQSASHEEFTSVILNLLQVE